MLPLRGISMCFGSSHIPILIACALVTACSHSGLPLKNEQSDELSVQKSKEKGDLSDSGASGDEAKEKRGLFGFFSPGVPEQDKVKEENDLKYARLWSRVDQLTSETGRLKERLKVLEKGLTLGLIPEELKNDGASEKVEVKPSIPPKAKAVAEDGANKEPEVIEENPSNGIKPEMGEAKVEPSENLEKEYQAAMALAHDQFRSGHYGRAIVEYDAIGKKFGDKQGGGSHKFWTARCWINMKEYATSRQLLAEFLKDHPGSSWAPRAKLELAKVEWRLGLGETALSRLRDVIRDHPQEDAAEMAKMELSTLDKTL